MKKLVSRQEGLRNLQKATKTVKQFLLVSGYKSGQHIILITSTYYQQRVGN